KRIKNAVAEQIRRRKAVFGGWSWLLIKVDSKEHMRLDLRQTNRVRFEVDEGAQMIEVRALSRKGDALLALYLLSAEESEDEHDLTPVSIMLEGGQKISFTVARTTDSRGEVSGAIIEIVYEETNPIRAAALYCRRLSYLTSRWKLVATGT